MLLAAAELIKIVPIVLCLNLSERRLGGGEHGFGLRAVLQFQNNAGSDIAAPSGVGKIGKAVARLRVGAQIVDQLAVSAGAERAQEAMIEILRWGLGGGVSDRNVVSKQLLQVSSDVISFSGERCLDDVKAARSETSIAG